MIRVVLVVAGVWVLVSVLLAWAQARLARRRGHRV